MALGLSVEGQDEACGHGREGLAQQRILQKHRYFAGKHRVGAWPRASVSRLHMGKAVGDEVGGVDWRRMIEKELQIGAQYEKTRGANEGFRGGKNWSPTRLWEFECGR